MKESHDNLGEVRWTMISGQWLVVSGTGIVPVSNRGRNMDSLS
jgi:tetrahydromethanopterin S-methyltransferase subunit D